MTAEGKIYRGHIRAMRADNEFFGAEDLMDCGEMWFKIVHTMHYAKRKAAGKEVADMWTLKLEDASGKPCRKELWLKATNRQSIAGLYGSDTTAWEGKWICLFVTEVRSPQGGMTLGIRVAKKTEGPKRKTEVT